MYISVDAARSEQAIRLINGSPNGKAHAADPEARYIELKLQAASLKEGETRVAYAAAGELLLEAARVAREAHMRAAIKPYTEPSPTMGREHAESLFAEQLAYAKAMAVEAHPICFWNKPLAVSKKKTNEAVSPVARALATHLNQNMLYTDTSSTKSGAYMDAVLLAIEANLPAERVSGIVPLLGFYVEKPASKIYDLALQKNRYGFARDFALQHGMNEAASAVAAKLRRHITKDTDPMLSAAEEAFDAFKKGNEVAAIHVAVEFNLQRYSEVYKRHISRIYEVIDQERDTLGKGILLRTAIDALAKAGMEGEASRMARDYDFFLMPVAQRRQWEILDAVRREARQKKVRRTELSFTPPELLKLLRDGQMQVNKGIFHMDVNALVASGEFQKTKGRLRISR